MKKLFLKNEFETEWNFPRARIPTQLAMPRLNTGAVAGLVALDLFNNTKVNDFSRKIELNCGDSRKQRKVRAALQKEIQHERVEIGKAFLIRHKGPDEKIDAMSSVLCALIESHGHCYENIDATSSVLCALIESHGYGEKIEEKAVEYTVIGHGNEIRYNYEFIL